jgi:hypothetical protein
MRQRYRRPAFSLPPIPPHPPPRSGLQPSGSGPAAGVFNKAIFAGLTSAPTKAPEESATPFAPPLNRAEQHESGGAVQLNDTTAHATTALLRPPAKAVRATPL